MSNSSVGGDLTQTINPKKLITKAVQGLFLGLVPLVSQSYLGSVWASCRKTALVELVVPLQVGGSFFQVGGS